MKNKSGWFWSMAVICMAELAAVFLINVYILNDGYYHFESSFEKSRYVERNLENSVFDLIGVFEGWRDEQWLGKLKKRDVEYMAVFGDRIYSNVDKDHLFSAYDLSVIWDENSAAKVEGGLSPLFKKELLKSRKITVGSLKAGIPEEKALAAEHRWRTGRMMMAVFGIGMTVLLGFLWHAGGKIAECRGRKESGTISLMKICALAAGSLMCLKYFRIFGIRIHRGIWPASGVLLLLLLAALGASACILLAAQIQYIRHDYRCCSRYRGRKESR